MNSDVADAEVLTKVITKELDIGLYPESIGQEESCINKLLKKNKFKYHQQLNGILIRYDDLEFLSKTGFIIDDNPLIFWKIRAKFHMLNVQKNQILKSFVNRIGKKYIGCSLANCINVTIKFEETIQSEIENICSNLNIGDCITFKVKSFIPSERYIEGIIDEEVFEILKTNLNSRIDLQF